MREIPPWFGLRVGAGPAEVVVVGCPYDGSVSGRAGAAAAPAAIREWARSAEAIDERGQPIRGLRVADHGDADPAGGVAAIRSHAREATAAHPGATLVGLGGDHSVTPGLLAATHESYPGLGLVMLDAHADLFEEYEGDRDSHACVVARAWDTVGVRPERTAFAGLRSYAQAELEPLARCGAAVSAPEWAEIGATAVAERLLRPLEDAPYYLSIDIDVLDPSAAPGTGYPVAGGPSSRQLLALLAALVTRRAPVAVDLVEVAPGLDPTGITAANAAQILLQLLGLLASHRADGRRRHPR